MRVKKAIYIKDYEIKLLFSNGIIKTVDFKPFLINAKNLALPLLNLDYFKRFYIDNTTICWPNGFDFCPDVLYNVGTDKQGKERASNFMKSRNAQDSVVMSRIVSSRFTSRLHL